MNCSKHCDEEIVRGDMHKKYFYHFLAVASISLILVMTNGCSKSEEGQTGEQGRIEKMTDQAAETAVKKIRTPINKARVTQNLGDERVQEMDKALDGQ
jgi:hypothetical protein